MTKGTSATEEAEAKGASTAHKAVAEGASAADEPVAMVASAADEAVGQGASAVDETVRCKPIESGVTIRFSPFVGQMVKQLKAMSGQLTTMNLPGFLGSGKTSTLKHLLENNSNIKIGTIVNDVASVNIDAKLVANSDAQRDGNQSTGNLDSEGVVELQNGCACCSLADELFTSIETLTRNGDRELDAIVVELSGVADPMAVRDNWAAAAEQGHPATRIANLVRTVTRKFCYSTTCKHNLM